MHGSVDLSLANIVAIGIDILVVKAISDHLHIVRLCFEYLGSLQGNIFLHVGCITLEKAEQWMRHILLVLELILRVLIACFLFLVLLLMIIIHRIGILILYITSLFLIYFVVDFLKSAVGVDWPTAPFLSFEIARASRLIVLSVDDATNSTWMMHRHPTKAIAANYRFLWSSSSTAGIDCGDWITIRPLCVFVFLMSI